MASEIAKPSRMSDEQLGAFICRVCTSYPTDWSASKVHAAIGTYIRECFVEDISPIKQLYTHEDGSVVALMANGRIKRRDAGAWYDISIPADA